MMITNSEARLLTQVAKYSALPLLVVGLWLGWPLMTGQEQWVIPSSGELSFYLGAALVTFDVMLMIAILLLAICFYRPFKDLDDAQLPSCTVIVPAYNEGRGVLNAIESVLASNYPAEKLEIIAIDDGSADDTWYWISRAAALHPGRIRPIRFEHNRGKRCGLHHGILLSEKDVIVTVDSDSVVEPDTLRRLNAPFVQHARIGAVAGNIRVLNVKAGILPRMMDVNFVFTFDILRSAQSVLRSVFCTPGALSAYRRAALLPFLDAWVTQTFMGEPAHIAEDRALSTHLLRDHWQIVFQRTAMARTIMPTDYRTMTKMFLRWGRGDVRETALMYGFAFKKIDLFQLGIIFQLMVQSMWLFLPVLLLPVVIAGIMAAPVLWMQCLFLTTLVWATVPALVYLARYGGSEALWAYGFSFFRLVGLFWLAPYCVLTVRNSRWMTRSRTSHAPVALPSDIPVVEIPANCHVEKMTF